VASPTFLCFSSLSTSRKSASIPILFLSGLLLNFNVCFWVALTDEVCSDFISVVALQDDFFVFCGSSAGAERFEFLG